ncbi:hypothetical protein BRC97_10600 [Halobacteriales archaeon QS_6_71_20]|nr:MAG: hypothetical protein BRC97_10600 [Halobacteriales archaeon QS_6_71_20]
MGYACPVCETPQRDGEHLANHLAFTAMLHGDAHEDWLDEHVDDWGGRTPAELAGDVTERATEAEYDEVFEDTTGSDGEHGRGHDHDADAGTDRRGGRPDVAGGAGGRAGTAADETVESVLAEARDLTEEMYEGDADDDRDGTDTETDGGE